MKLVLPLLFIKASLLKRDPSFARLFSMVLNPSGWNLFIPLYGFFGSYSNNGYPSQSAYLMQSLTIIIMIRAKQSVNPVLEMSNARQHLPCRWRNRSRWEIVCQSYATKKLCKTCRLWKIRGQWRMVIDTFIKHQMAIVTICKASGFKDCDGDIIPMD
mgnify:CR=1 FL=1